MSPGCAVGRDQFQGRDQEGLRESFEALGQGRTGYSTEKTEGTGAFRGPLATLGSMWQTSKDKKTGEEWERRGDTKLQASFC